MRADETRRILPLDQADDYEVADGDPDVRGWDVITSDGQKAGKVDELLVDPSAMRVRYLAVELDDRAGRGDRKVLLPIGAARLHEEEDHVHVAALTVQTLGALPEYDEDRFDDRHETDLRARLDSRYTADPTVTPEFYRNDLYDDRQFYGSRRRI